MNPRRRRHPLTTLLTSLVCGVVVVCLQLIWPGAAQRLDHIQYDFLMRMRPSDPPVDDRLVLFGIDDRTVQTLKRYPVARSSHARLTEGLGKAGAKLVVWDVIFDLPTADDEAFAAAMEKMPTVLAAGTIRLQEGVAPDTTSVGSRILNRFSVTRIEAGRPQDLEPYAFKLVMDEKLLTDSVSVGHASPSLDDDGVCRRLPIVIDIDGHLLPSLSLACVMRMLDIDPKDMRFVEPGVLRVGALTLEEPLDIPVDPQGMMLINYFPGWQDAVDRRSYAMQLESLSEFPEDMAEGLKGRVVLIGETQSAGGDFVPTPLEKTAPGMVVVATAVNTLLTRRFIAPASPAAVLILSVLCALMVGLAFLSRRPLVSCVAVIVVLGGLITASTVLFFNSDYYLPIIAPLVAALLAAGALISIGLVLEQRRSSRMAGFLAKFVSPSVLEEMESRDFCLSGLPASRKELSILFVDMVGFTERASESEPEEIARFLSAFYDAALGEIHARGGTLDKVHGDGVLAYFGAPQALEDKEQRAVEASLALVEKAGELSRAWAHWGKAGLEIRCGIATDYVTLGYFGGKQYAAYTVIGRAVNLSARLQQHARPGDVLVDRHTSARIENKFRTEQIESVTLKGIEKPVEAWRVTGRI